VTFPERSAHVYPVESSPPPSVLWCTTNLSSPQSYELSSLSRVSSWRAHWLDRSHSSATCPVSDFSGPLQGRGIIMEPREEWDDRSARVRRSLLHMGHPHTKSKIEIDGRPFHITRNLEWALRHLRLPRKEVRLWADSICVYLDRSRTKYCWKLRCWPLFYEDVCSTPHRT